MPIFKMLGLFGLMAVSTMLGFYKANSLKMRSRKITRICMALSSLSQLVKCGVQELEPLISRTFERDLAVFKGGQAVVNSDYLSKEDRAILNEFFKGLGRDYKAGEYDRVIFYKNMLQKQQELAENDVKQLYRLYSSIGFLSGLLICILFV